ncbi:unnamed protein product [Prorocentrum cordatum]|uniref:AB hydrolase-1 domain-containing protein n=1 Tax=Prorocentrum cordatum TaxID=2364126 RepID=A0ABN9UPF6_9DINO|nr:unnamed protein product [Polarella glacialis]
MALQGGGWCSCGTSYNLSGRHFKIEDKECWPVCSGERALEPSRPCGGFLANAVYALESTRHRCGPPAAAAAAPGAGGSAGRGRWRGLVRSARPRCVGVPGAGARRRAERAAEAAYRRGASRDQPMDLPRLRPAVLLLHDGPGLANAASLLEPLAWRLCREGCTCFLPALTRGMPNRTSMRANVGDAQDDVARFMYERLGEFEMHAVGHGYGGVVIMEALLRAGPWEDTARGFLSALEGGQTPRLRSVSLLGTPSSTGVLRSEALRLFRAALKDRGNDSQRDEGAAEREFWERHFSSGSSLVAEAYMRAAWKPWEDFPLRGRQEGKNTQTQILVEAQETGKYRKWLGRSTFRLWKDIRNPGISVYLVGGFCAIYLCPWAPCVRLGDQPPRDGEPLRRGLLRRAAPLRARRERLRHGRVRGRLAGRRLPQVPGPVHGARCRGLRPQRPAAAAGLVRWGASRVAVRCGGGGRGVEARPPAPRLEQRSDLLQEGDGIGILCFYQGRNSLPTCSGRPSPPFPSSSFSSSCTTLLAKTFQKRFSSSSS